MSSMDTTHTAAQPFAVVRKGFDREQVNSVLSRLEAEVELLRADRDAAVQRADRAAADLERERERVAALEARVAELGKAPVTADQMSDRLSTMLGLANAEAASVRDTAHASADQILTQAEDDAWRLRESASAELDEIRSRNAAIRSEHAQVLETARSRAAEIIRASERAARTQDEEAARRRAEVDEDHQLASDLRRQESLREDEALQATSRKNAETAYLAAAAVAQKTLDDARAEATAMIDGARTYTERLRTLRKDVLSDIAAIRARLEVVPSSVDEQPLPTAPAIADGSSSTTSPGLSSSVE